MEIKIKYLPYTYTILITNCNNFEMFVFPYYLLTLDSHNYWQPSSIYAFLAKMLTVLISRHFYLVPKSRTFAYSQSSTDYLLVNSDYFILKYCCCCLDFACRKEVEKAEWICICAILQHNNGYHSLHCGWFLWISGLPKWYQRKHHAEPFGNSVCQPFNIPFRYK